jgi:glycine cleavage system H lipoate-binding protein
MSILFVLLTFLLIISITYFRRRSEVVATAAVHSKPAAPQLSRELGFDIPKGFSFHPGHAWVLDEGRQNARVGLDAFASNLLGKIDKIEVTGINRWVRQGQKLATVTSGDTSIDLISPIEGVITSLNYDAIENPEVITKDPYQTGWICAVKSPDLATNMKNLIQGTLIAPWMQNTLARVSAMTQQLSPALAQDGGVPVQGLLAKLEPGIRRKLIQEFFLA